MPGHQGPRAGHRGGCARHAARRRSRARPRAHLRARACSTRWKGELRADARAVDIDHAAVRRAGGDVTLITYGGTLDKALAGGRGAVQDGIEAEVIDLRTLRPLDDETIWPRSQHAARGHRRRRMAHRQPGGRDQRTDHGAGVLRARCAGARVCSAEVPIPYPKHLEDAALPQPPRHRRGREGAWATHG